MTLTTQLKSKLQKELLERTLRCKKPTYLKLHVGQVVLAGSDLKYIYQPPGIGKSTTYTANEGEKLLIMVFVQNRGKKKMAGDRFRIYAKSLETGDPIECSVTDVVPCAFNETLNLFR